MEADSSITSSSPQKRKLTRASTACSACRKLKMKCVGGTEDGKPCNRCARTGKECLLLGRQRKRPSEKKDAEIQALKAKLKDMEEKLGEGEQSPIPMASDSSDPHPHLDHQPQPFLTMSNPDSSIPTGIPTETSQSGWLQTIVGPSPDSSSNTSLPSLHHSSYSNFDMKASSPVASSNSSNSHTAARFQVTSLDKHWLETNSKDLPFLKSGKLSIEDSINLFKLFMLNCLPHTVILDIEYHTLTKVGKPSNGFLLACILFLASAYDKERPKLQKTLQEEMDLLIGKIITSGEKSVEIIQGFLLLYWWTKPSTDSSRDLAWLYSGIAIRLATNLNLGTCNSFERKKTDPIQEQEDERESRNKQRTWLMCYLVDRTLSASVGKQYTIKGDDYLCRNSDSWFSLPSARPWDLAISVLADMVKITSRQVDVLNTAVGAHTSQNDEIDFDCETMMRMHQEELVNYRKKWNEKGPVFPSSEGAISGNSPQFDANAINLDQTDIHNYVFHHVLKQAKLRYNYAVLVLNSFGLQYCATRNSSEDAGVRTFCISHAITAARNIVLAARDGLSASLSYAPHTQFTIISYGIISLIKLASLKKDDAVISQRLIDLVESGISFLEKVSISSTSTPARCASLLRAVLRRKRANDRLNRFDEKPAYRPGMEEHVLPLESSRASSPFHNHHNHHQHHHHHHHRPMSSNHLPIFSSSSDNDSANPKGFSSSSPSSCSTTLPPLHQIESQDQFFNPTSSSSSSSSSHHQTTYAQSPSQARAQSAASPYPWSLSPDAIIANLGILPSSSDEDQMFGVFGNDGSLGWDQLTADQVLDDSFWLKLR